MARMSTRPESFADRLTSAVGGDPAALLQIAGELTTAVRNGPLPWSQVGEVHGAVRELLGEATAELAADLNAAAKLLERRAAAKPEPAEDFAFDDPERGFDKGVL